MNSEVTVLDEPDLSFRFGQGLTDPRRGLSLFGPYDGDMPSHPSAIPYAVIGPSQGIEAFKRWVAAVQGPVFPSGDFPNTNLWPMFPGFEAVFGCKMATDPVWTHHVDRVRLLHDVHDADQSMRVYKVVNTYLEGVKIGVRRDERPAVIICVVPDDVHRCCRPKSRVTEAHGHRPTERERRLRSSQDDLFGEYTSEAYDLAPDFRRQLKARVMEYGIPIQIVQESTLSLTEEDEPTARKLTPLSDRAWNILTTLYYKAGGKPWKLATARPGVCYIGIAFRRVSETGNTACCAAQMFLDSGDGVVFLGETGAWYSPVLRECHLNREAARALLSGVLQTYQELEGQPLTEVFLHSRSTISDEEFAGYCDACSSGTKVVGIRVRRDSARPKLFRPGDYPVLRGTFWKLNQRAGYLWASGFKRELRSYDGWEVPNPLRIDVEHGDTDLDQVAQDIFGLTKLNYNACRLGESRPVTIGFSDQVGEILVTNPGVPGRKPNFKYYI